MATSLMVYGLETTKEFPPVGSANDFNDLVTPREVEPSDCPLLSTIQHTDF